MERIAKFISGVIEGCDPDLGAHHDRLGNLSRLFSSRINCRDTEAEALVYGARLHDIGKISINDFILNKPSRLTPAEFSLVKEHTNIGLSMLAPLRLDPRIGEIVQFHHENFDGSGYPHGLAGHDIPLLARVTRILDSFDAITSDRAYHKGVTQAEALEIMEQSSHCYDPEFLGEFCAMIRGRQEPVGFDTDLLRNPTGA